MTAIENLYFPEIVRAVEDAALDRCRTVLLCNGADDPAREAAYLELLTERRVDGIIVASSGLQERHSDWLAPAVVPVVLVNRTADGSHHPAILIDNRTGGRIAAEHVLALGQRRMAAGDRRVLPSQRASWAEARETASHPMPRMCQPVERCSRPEACTHWKDSPAGASAQLHPSPYARRRRRSHG